jgi:hypothetical protein
MRRAADGQCRLEIYLADPESPAVQVRLIEEELGDARPSVGRSGLRHRLEALLEEAGRLGSPPTLSIRLFGHYPGFALLIADQHYFVYPYGYATLGNFSPVIRFSKDDPDDRDVIEFLDRQYEQIQRSSTDAAFVADVRAGRKGRAELLPFALYFVPQERSSLYGFGSSVLGYDVRTRAVRGGWPQGVGAAVEFGFHLTCCDVLYFVNRRDLELAIEEVAFVARDLQPFELDGLALRAGFPDPRCISIEAQDPSGTLEALHCELVHRVYRLAGASNYTLEPLEPTRTSAVLRASLMTKRFKAPYILKAYQPHFTLLADLDPSGQDAALQALSAEFARLVRERWITVDRLAVMERPAGASHWTIAREIPLGH